MPINANYSRSYTVNGRTFGTQQTVSSAVAIDIGQDLTAAWAGTLTTRTDAATGTLTMASGSHTITTGARLDIYWTNADGTFGHRRGVTVGTVAGTSVPFSLGAGDNLPTAASAVTAQVPTQLSVVVTGNTVVSISASCVTGGLIVFTDNVPTEMSYAFLTSSSQSYCWTSTDGGTNPLAGKAVTRAYVSQPNSVTTPTFYGTIQHN